MWEYGHSYEGRPLKLVAVSSPENLERLEEIRKDVLRLAEPAALSAAERERIVRRTPLIVWLAYGVHGNEASSAEAAMGTAYVLAAAQGETAELLKNVVVLIDPLQNPDGRERYVNAYRQRRGDEANLRRTAAEHFEPWPGGRQNHYLIDLNRDWAWASQQETRQRIAAYRSWEPQVYVDFHEMGTESSYFFPPRPSRSIRRSTAASSPGSTPSAAPTPPPSTTRGGSTSRKRTTTSSTPATATPTRACAAPWG